MANVLLRVHGVSEEVLAALVDRGYFATKTEALRAGLLKLGEEFGLIGSPEYYRARLEEGIAASGKRMNLKELERAVAGMER